MGACVRKPEISSPSSKDSNARSTPSKKARFCVCETADGTDSFICTQCHLIKKRARDKAREMKQSRERATELKKERETDVHYENPFDSDDDSVETDSSSNKTGDDTNASVLTRIKASLTYRTYQELALKKVFNDFDADNNKYIDAMELRLMTCDYEDGTEIYQSLTQEDAELYIELVDETGDKLLDENQFVACMMECLRYNIHTQCKKYGGGLHVLHVFTKIRRKYE